MSAPARLPTGARRPGGGPPWMAAGIPVEKSMTFWPSGRRLFGRFARDRLALGAVLLLGIVSVTFSVIGPKLLGDATDVIFGGVIGRQLPAGVSPAQAVEQARAAGNSHLANLISGSKVTVGGIDFHQLWHILLVVLVLYVASSVLSWLQGYLVTGVVQRMVRDLRGDVEAKLHRLPLPYLDDQPRGEVLSRVTNDIDNIGQTLQQTLSQLLTSLLTLVGVLAMMFWISWLLALIALIIVPLSMIVTKQIAKRSQKQFISQWGRTGSLSSEIEEAYTGHEIVKVFGRQREVEASFDATNQALYESSFRAQFISGTIMPAMMFLGNLNYAAIAVVGGLRVAGGSISLGSVQAFIQYSRQFTQPLTQVASMANLLQSGVASAERVFELLDATEQLPDPSQPKTLDDPSGRVEFEHVDFRYLPDQPLIEDLSLLAEPGHTIAIVGPTGAGKTTLVNLVMRFYEINAGRITLDGVPTTELTRSDLRSLTGMVLQDAWLFGGTIRENIAYGDLSATDEQILTAAKATFVDRFVHSLPEGYDTVVDFEGGNISVGERQLITIARAFLANPALLILDEATSSVDTRTEVLLQRAMAALRQERTSFVIAHRLSTIRDADLILVMEHGQIVEQGNHDELIAAEGAYFRLYSAQFARGEGTGAAEDPELVGNSQ